MSNALVKSESADSKLEIIDAKESAAILKRCEEKITHAQSLLKRGEQMNDTLRLAIGFQINIARPVLSITNGNETGEKKGDGLAHWVKEKFDLEARTANNYARFAETFALVANSKSETVSDLKKLLPEISQGELDFSERREEVQDIVSAVMGDLGMIDFIDQHAPARKGGLMPIKFHCPVCRHALKGIAGRNVKCPACSNTCKAKPDAKDTSEADREAAGEALRELASQIESIIGNAEGPSASSSEWALAPDEDRLTFLNACLRATTHARKTKIRSRKQS